MNLASTPYRRNVFVMSRTCSKSTQNARVLRLSAGISYFIEKHTLSSVQPSSNGDFVRIRCINNTTIRSNTSLMYRDNWLVEKSPNLLFLTCRKSISVCAVVNLTADSLDIRTTLSTHTISLQSFQYNPDDIQSHPAPFPISNHPIDSGLHSHLQPRPPTPLSTLQNVPIL